MEATFPDALLGRTLAAVAAAWGFLAPMKERGTQASQRADVVERVLMTLVTGLLWTMVPAMARQILVRLLQTMGPLWLA